MCAAGCRATTVCVFVIATVVNTLFKDAEKHQHVAGSVVVLLQSIMVKLRQRPRYKKPVKFICEKEQKGQIAH